MSAPTIEQLAERIGQLNLGPDQWRVIVAAMLAGQQPKPVRELPAASVHLHYRGDHRGTEGLFRGPQMLGEYLTVVSVEYSPERHQSRVGLAYGLYVHTPTTKGE